MGFLLTYLFRGGALNSTCLSELPSMGFRRRYSRTKNVISYVGNH